MTFSISLLAQNNDGKAIDKVSLDWHFTAYLSPLLIPDIGVGISNVMITESGSMESSAILHGLYNPWEKSSSEYKRVGVKIRNNYFFNREQVGCNWSFSAGFDFHNIGVLTSPSWILFPELAIGYGYGWELSNNHQLRTSIDFGFKILVSNIYISYRW